MLCPHVRFSRQADIRQDWIAAMKAFPQTRPAASHRCSPAGVPYSGRRQTDRARKTDIGIPPLADQTGRV